MLVINSKGEGVPNATVQVFELDLNSEIREYRTNDEGRCRVLVDARSRATELHAHTSDRDLGWARISQGGQSATGTDNDPVKILLLARNHQVDGWCPGQLIGLACFG